MTTTPNGTPVEACTRADHHGGHEWHQGGLFRRYCPGNPVPHAEPAPVPPPVEALSKLIDDFGQAIEYSCQADASGDTHEATRYMLDSQETRDDIVKATSALWAAGVEEGRRQATEESTEEIDRLHALLEHAEQYARDLQDNGDVPTPVADLIAAETRALTRAYWKLREHAAQLRTTFVYTNAQDRAKEATEAERDGMAMRSDGRWREKAAGLRSYSRGVEAGARLLAELLGVEENEIERPGAVDRD